MAGQKFSEKYGFAPSTRPLPFDEVPPWLREEVVNLTRKFIEERAEPGVLAIFGSELYMTLKPVIWRVLDKEPPGSPIDGPWASYIPAVIKKCEWWQFYDICEDIHNLIARKSGEFDPQPSLPGPSQIPHILFAEKMNALFAREGVIWRFKNGSLERAQTLLLVRRLNKLLHF